MRWLIVTALVVAAGCTTDDAAPSAHRGPTDDPLLPLAHDEDGDGVADAMDDCPHVADPDQVDDGEREAGALPDGVGDACDPQPTLSGNAIALFDPMITASPWGVVDGDATRLGVPGWIVLDDRAIPGRAVLQAQVRIAATDGGTGGVVMTRRDGAGGCQLFADRLSLGAAAPPAPVAVPMVPAGTPMTLALTTARGRWQCAWQAAGAPMVIATAGVDADDAGAGHAHFYAMADHAWVDYVVAITLAP